MRSRIALGIVIAVLLCLPFLGWSTARIYRYVQFDRAVSGHLKRAADANTVELAEKEVAVAVAYLKQNGLTSGYTSVWWTTPDEDMGFWYSNLTASLEELHKIAPTATQLEKSNLLMKLRETLVDAGQKVSVTVPEGASIFPRNALYWWWGWLSSVVAVAGIIVGLAVGNSQPRYRYR